MNKKLPLSFVRLDEPEACTDATASLLIYWLSNSVSIAYPAMVLHTRAGRSTKVHTGVWL